MPGRPQMILTDRDEFARLVDRHFPSAIALARTSGVNRQTIGWLLSPDGRSTTSKKSATALAEALGIPVARLFRPWSRDDASPRDEESMLLTIPQVRNALQCSETHVYRLLADGELEATDISVPGSSQSKTRVPRTSLAAYVKRQTRSAKGTRRREPANA